MSDPASVFVGGARVFRSYVLAKTFPFDIIKMLMIFIGGEMACAAKSKRAHKECYGEHE